MTITQEHRENLEALRDEMRERVLLENFNMFDYYTLPSGDEYPEEVWIEDYPASLRELLESEMAACPIGTAMLMRRFSRYMDEHDCFNETEAFGFEGDRVRDYLFSSDWADYDNTPTGAADRIDYYLEHGKAGPLPWGSKG